MKKVIYIDGGAGRAIAALPALEKLVRNKKPEDDIKIIVMGWDNLYWGNQLLQDITFSADTKGIFDLVIKGADKSISPEPYKIPEYYNQKVSLSEAFDIEINGTHDHSDLPPLKMYTSKAEEKNAANLIADVKMQQKKDKTLIIQPYGRSARVDRADIIDDSSRGLDSHAYLRLVRKLSTKYNLILFAEKPFHQPDDAFTFKPEMDLRSWSAVIEAADYFVGCDSVGQHMARAFDKPGTVFIGSTFAKNVSYPDWFNIYERPGIEKKYSPIRISGLDSHLADRYNDKCMDLSDKDVDDLFMSIVKDIEKKVGK
jgi:ADP-heptose:LPS heptosyltransferase